MSVTQGVKGYQWNYPLLKRVEPGRGIRLSSAQPRGSSGDSPPRYLSFLSLTLTHAHKSSSDWIANLQTSHLISVYQHRKLIISLTGDGFTFLCINFLTSMIKISEKTAWANTDCFELQNMCISILFFMWNVIWFPYLPSLICFIPHSGCINASHFHVILTHFLVLQMLFPLVLTAHRKFRVTAKSRERTRFAFPVRKTTMERERHQKQNKRRDAL
jgi:hypothetical protein